MQQLRLFFAMALLYMFRVTITQHSAFRGTARHNKTVITYNSTRPTTIRLP